MIYPVILCGGSGTRLWPMSRSLHPKPFLPLLGRASLLQETVLRVTENSRFAAPFLLAHEEHRFLVAEQLRELAALPRALVLEPVGRNTAPATCVAALALAEEDDRALLLALPSDHAIADREAFLSAVDHAAEAARAGRLVAFGVKPVRAETGYGYIRRGAPLAGAEGAFAIGAFVEKPDAERAEAYLASGEFFWNSGMFLFPARLYLEELRRLRPDIVEGCQKAFVQCRRDSDFIRLAAEPFAAVAGESIDYAVMEKTERAVVVPVEMGWSDVGSWDSLWELSAKDEAGNACEGNVVALDSRNSYLRSTAGILAAVGVEDLIAVATEDAVLVAPRQRAQEVKSLVGQLVAEGREAADAPATVHRPWGSFKPLHLGNRVQVKHIVVKPGAKLSLQLHHHRAEHWVVVAGTAKILRGSEEMILTEDQSAYIPLGTPHRLENPGKIPLHLIEVQSGSYLGEDDIVRLEDSYGRS